MSFQRRVMLKQLAVFSAETAFKRSICGLMAYSSAPGDLGSLEAQFLSLASIDESDGDTRPFHVLSSELGSMDGSVLSSSEAGWDQRFHVTVSKQVKTFQSLLRFDTDNIVLFL